MTNHILISRYKANTGIACVSFSLILHATAGEHQGDGCHVTTQTLIAEAQPFLHLICFSSSNLWADVS